MSARLVAVVGAGVAGLACAQRLRASGRTVVVFDKGRRPGGRVSTRRHDGLQFDHGAQFFTARDPRFVQLVMRCEDQGQVARWGGPFATLAAGYLGDDPRAKMRVEVPRGAALQQLADKVRAFDRRSRCGPWAVDALRAIARQLDQERRQLREALERLAQLIDESLS